MTTILFVPPPDRADVLAPSVGGGLVPQAVRVGAIVSDARHPDRWVVASGGVIEVHYTNPEDDGDRPPDEVHLAEDCPMESRALLLAFKGAPDPIGMGRARDVLAAFEEFDPNEAAFELSSPPGGCTGPGCRLRRGDHDPLDYEEIEAPARYVSADVIVPGLAAVAPGDRAHALATILVARIGGSVVLV